MDLEKLDQHVQRICKRNLNNKRIKCCARCPFEDIISHHFPLLKELFEEKKEALKDIGA